MCNTVSWNPTPKEGGLPVKVVPKHDTSNYVDQLASKPIGNIVDKPGDIVWSRCMIQEL